MPIRPPLNALHVFCAVARAGGFRQAAQTLCVTPSAVSRQIRGIEEHLGHPLFDRSGQGSELTPVGRKLFERVGDRMDALCHALDGTRAGGRQAIVLVDTSVTLAMHWLIPRLRAFAERHPRLHARVQTTDGEIEIAAPVDVFIRREAGELRGLPAQALMDERSVLVASPALCAGRRRTAGGSLSPARLPRVGARSRPDLWPRWCSARRLRPLEPTIEFDNTVLAIQAALQGLGACVVPEMFVTDMLRSGTLGLLDPTRVETGAYHYAIGRRRESARADAFVAWMRTLAHA